MRTAQIVWWQWCMAGAIALFLIGGIWKMSVAQQAPQPPELPPAAGAMVEPDSPVPQQPAVEQASTPIQ